jgi:hypothetical protein
MTEVHYGRYLLALQDARRGLGLAVFEEGKHRRDAHGRFAKTFYHGTSKAAAKSIRAKGLSAGRIFMASDDRATIGSDSDGATLKVKSVAKNPLHVVVPPFNPDAPLIAEHRRALGAALKQLGIKISDQERADLPTGSKRQAALDALYAKKLREAGHDALHVEFEKRGGGIGESWVMALDPKAVAVS